ncbi:GGDEF domain-containing protein [Geobacter sp. AOG2]|uniref:sensor domain-containing diguanylate cyclase n=1 Tax=Geobacter sp. AOG2 TaxID=1566347 RepID=UPI001CC4FAC6|nr:GGDEF domain-containing protein [Geobacter sp. AOG2]GFE61157.1 hypothetical protein AOG2_17440 [Geobacter sp. AOG2]
MQLTPAQELLTGNIRLPSPPAIAIKILETVRKENFSFEDLARVIESDPALAARVLKTANSSYYSQNQKISSIEKSLAILGTHAVKNIALSFVICSELMCEPYEIFDATVFWRRALSSAVAAEMILKLTGQQCADIFVIALLQDIGIMVMHGCRPRDYQLVFNYRKGSSLPLPEVERLIFGCDHQDVGAELLKSWQLPEEIYESIRHHHQDNLVPEKYRLQADILSIANDLSSFYSGKQDVNRIRHLKSVLDSKFSINGSAVDDLIESVGTQTLAVLSSFDIAPGKLRPFSLILQEANEGLSQLYDSYALQIIELKQAKERLEEQAHELSSANKKLQELASRDSLTGIFNYRIFQEAMDREMLRSQRYGHEFSLIVFDVDNLKKINDEHGHSAGDQILIEICKAVGKTIRAVDVFVRWGGDEFAIIMPETGGARALVVAEHLKDCVEALIVQMDNEIIKTKISIGLTSCDLSKLPMDKRKIIHLSDTALLKAKESGKNKICALFSDGLQS